MGRWYQGAPGQGRWPGSMTWGEGTRASVWLAQEVLPAGHRLPGQGSTPSVWGRSRPGRISYRIGIAEPAG